MNALIKKAITALLVNPEQQIPMDVNTAVRKNNPIYDPVMPPLSIAFVDNDCMVNTYNKVGSNTKRIIIKTAKYLPKTICHLDMGRVNNISKVPVLNSSESERIVNAGIMNKKIHGENSKNLSRVAYPKSNKLLSFKTNKVKPLTSKNKVMVIYPVKLPKNWCNSFLAIEIIRFKYAAI